MTEGTECRSPDCRALLSAGSRSGQGPPATLPCALRSTIQAPLTAPGEHASGPQKPAWCCLWRPVQGHLLSLFRGFPLGLVPCVPSSIFRAALHRPLLPAAARSGPEASVPLVCGDPRGAALACPAPLVCGDPRGAALARPALASECCSAAVRSRGLLTPGAATTQLLGFVCLCSPSWSVAFPSCQHLRSQTLRTS